MNETATLGDCAACGELAEVSVDGLCRGCERAHTEALDAREDGARWFYGDPEGEDYLTHAGGN